MRTPRLHLFNGDSTAQAFAQSGMESPGYVWREMLSDGPTVGVPGQPQFWKARSAYMANTHGITEGEYHQKTVAEWQLMVAAELTSEWVLWYEYDLFCQINLIALLAGLQAAKALPLQLSLVCMGQQDDGTWHSLGHYSPAQYPALLATRSPLDTSAIAYAAEVWKAYTAPDPRALQPYEQQRHPAFPYLAQALHAHANRFPNAQTGLNAQEKALLNLIATHSAPRNKIISMALRQLNHPYGFGDLQWFHYLDAVSPLWDETETGLQLSKLGKSVQEGVTNYRDHLPHRWLGGAQAKGFVWDAKNGQIIPQGGS